MDYLLLIVSSALFGGMFVFQQMYTRSEGSLLRSTLIFGLLTGLMRFPLAFVLYGTDYSFNLAGILFAVLYAVVGISTTLFSAKAFGVTNMALYSVFMMLGGMLLPFAVGLIFYDEPLTVGKAIGCLLVAVAVAVGAEFTDEKKNSVKGMFYCFGVFIMNGLCGVFAKVNQSAANGLDSGSFFLAAAVTTVLCNAVLVAALSAGNKEKLLKNPKKALAASVLYGLSSGGGNLLLLIALESLPASVQYPLVTGTTMAFSALFGLCRKEKLTRRTALSVGLALVASVVVVF